MIEDIWTMVNIVLCGPAGAGKHRLQRELCQKVKIVKKYRCISDVARLVLDDHKISSRLDYRCDDRFYVTVQREIINRQSVTEKTIQGDFITDNCIINALCHLSVCLPGNDIINDIVKEGSIVFDTLSQYKSSLVVLLGPCSHTHDDGICLKLKQKDWDDMKQTYTSLFHTFKIPFVDIVSTDISERFDIVKTALDGKLCLETSNLGFYDPKLKPEDQIVQTNFSFFKTPPVRDGGINIPTIKVTEHAYEQDWTRFQEGLTNRFIFRHGHANLVCIDFDINLRSSVVHKMLLNGINVNGEHYSFLGCSTNGLKCRKCYMLKGTSEDIVKVLEQEGDFKALKTVSKRLARIALLFTAVKLTTVKIEVGDVVEESDIIHGDNNFSDGCGGIGKVVAQKVFAEVRDAGHEEVYIPSVFQVRLQGYKGLLQVDESIDGHKIKVRPSMKKFETDRHPYIGICDYSRAYTFGHLNKQFIQLLSGLGVPDESFEMKHDAHLKRLNKMTTNAESAIEMLQWQNEFEFAQIIVKAGSLENIPEAGKQMVTQRLHSIQRDMVKKLGKLRILIPHSRNVFGICDTSGILEYGECFLRITISGKVKTIRGQVVVCKNPCYLLGDVRVLKAVDETDKPGLRKLNHIKDCIVFPTKGKRPHSNEIAGSDLDGDQYFVTWDSDLIPPEIRRPYGYPAASTKEQGEITPTGIIAYFSRQNEMQKLVGKIDSFYNKWADLQNVTSTECERLGQLFSRIIDAGKSGEELDIPKGLYPPEDFEERLKGSKLFIWKKMRNNAKEFEETFTERIVEKDEEVSNDFVMNVAQTKYSNISEYQKFRFVVNHISRNEESQMEIIEQFMDEYATFVNFSVFSIAERRDAIEMGVPTKYVMNALNKSTILSEEDLKQFSMESPRNTWNEYLSLAHTSFDWSQLIKALTTSDNTLLVLDMPDDTIIELQFLEKQELGLELPVKPGTISAVFYSKHFGYKLRYILGETYVLDLTEDTLQLYRETKKNLTFVWLKATDRKITKRRWNKRVSDEVVNSVSIDLQRFNRRILDVDKRHPLVNKTPFIAMEIYTQRTDGEIPYWDIYDANDIMPIEEAMEEETESPEDFVVDVANLFPDEEFAGHILSEENFTDTIGNAIQTGNPYLVRSILQTWSHDVPTELARCFVTLLENVLMKVAPKPLPDTIQMVLLEILPYFTNTLKDPTTILSVAGLLARLHMDDVASQIVHMNLKEMLFTVAEFLDILDLWVHLWYVDYSASMVFLRQLYRGTNIRSCGNDAVYAGRNLEYVRRFAFLHASSLLEEMKTNRRQFEESNCESRSKSQSIETQTCIMFLKLDTTANREENEVSFYRTHAVDIKSQITQGQYVAISRQKHVKDLSFKAICCIGQIRKIRFAPCTMTVQFSENVPNTLMQSLTTEGVRYWRADLIGNLATYTRIISALKLFASGNCCNQLVQCLVHPMGFKQFESMYTDGKDDPFPEVAIEPVHCDQARDLNEVQTNAITASLKQRLSLIQGPPGTGKTTLACHVIKQVLKSGKYTGILAVAETNVAVDNIARRLRNECLIIRIGSSEGIAKDLFDVSLEGQVKLLAEREAKKAEVRDERGDLHRNTRLMTKVLNAADVVLTTCAGAGDTCLETYKFEFVLVDEATQTRETTLLCSLTHGVKHVTMIGDPKQLGPMVECSKMDDCEDGHDIPKLSELSETLFHRLHGLIPSSFLNVQHRMHPEIMAFPSAEFYEGKLKAAPSVLTRREIIFPWPAVRNKSVIPLCFVNVSGRERRRGTSFFNIKEVEVVQRVIDVLLNVDENKYREHRIGVDQIGVLTFYQGQCVELKAALRHRVLVSSVDGFQGQEKDVIVVSAVRCNDRRIVGFSGDPRRINVLMTRAKRGLIIVGNENTLQGSEIWSRWLQQAPRLGVDAIKPVP